MATASASCAPGSSVVTLEFSDAPPPAKAAKAAASQQQPRKKLVTDRAVLWHASRVLRNMFEDTAAGRDGSTVSSSHGGCSSPAAAVLRLSGDRPEDWEVALRLLQASGDVLSLITWDNVAQLCRLADKYDISAVRNYCACFLSANASKLSLKEPLTSPQNLLHAASLAERYLGQLPAGTQAVREALDTMLVRIAPNLVESSSAVSNLWSQKGVAGTQRLLALARSAEYPDILTPDVQERIQTTLLDALEAVVTSCQW